jgi:hypothetical protein
MGDRHCLSVGAPECIPVFYITSVLLIFSFLWLIMLSIFWHGLYFLLWLVILFYVSEVSCVLLVMLSYNIDMYFLLDL